MDRLYPQTVIFILGALLCAGAALLGLRRRDKPGGWPFIGLMLACAVWTGGAAVESAVMGESLKVFWSQMEYCGLVFVGIFLLFFALAYTRQTQLLGRDMRLLLWLIPLGSLALVWTNPWHHAMWTRFSPGSEAANVLVYHRGPFFWFIPGYTYAFIALGFGVFANACRSCGVAIRRQYLVFMLSGLFPLGTGCVYLFGQNWVKGMDVAPMGFSVAGLMIAWNFFRLQLLDLVPIGREMLVEKIPDGMIVFDGKGRLVDINPTARRLLGAVKDPEDSRILREQYPALEDLFVANEEKQCELTFSDGTVDVSITMVPLYRKGGQLQGRLLILHDITEQKAVAREREKNIAELSQAIAQIKTLENLLPICCSCKKIRDDNGYWQQLEAYILEHAGVTFSHGLCPECARKLYKESGDSVICDLSS